MSDAAVVKRRATYEDLLAVPDHLVAEMLDGELYTSPRRSLPHAVASSGLGGDLSGPFDRGRGGPGGWHILFGPEVHLGPDILVPDLAGWRRERVPVVPKTAYMDVSPDWVCETVSPSTERLDRGKKLDIYAREGVAHLWLLNPLIETLEAYRLQHQRWMRLQTYVGDVAVRVEPFDAIEIELWRLWGRTAPGG